MKSTFASLLYSLKSVYRRKAKNIYAILGIALGVSLLLGVQVSVDSVEQSWLDGSIYSIGKRHIQVFGTASPVFPEFLYTTYLENSLVNSSSHIKSVTARLSWKGTLLNDATGDIEVAVPFMGVNPLEKGFGEYYNASNLDQVLSLSQLQSNELYLGEDLANRLSVEVDENITISIGFGDKKSEGIRTIRGIYGDKGRGEEDFATHAVLSLADLQALLPFGQSINVIYLAITDDVDTKPESEALVNDIRAKLNTLGDTIPPEFILPGYQISDLFSITDVRQATKDSIGPTMDALRMIMNVFGALVIFAGLLLIINIQFMSVEDREVQTGISRAIGVQRRQVILQLIVEAGLLGIIAAFVAIPMGSVYAYFLIYMFAQTFGLPLEVTRLIITPNVLIQSLILGISLALFTALLPAVRASRINIVEVIRGIIPPPEERFSRRGFYLGIGMLILGIIWFFTLDKAPWEGPSAFRNINDAEAIYFPFILIFVSVPLILSYFVVNKHLVMNFMALSLLALPLFYIFVVFDWIEEGSGGTMAILGILLSLVIGSIVFIGLNLDFIADGAEAFTKYFKALAAIAQVAFRNMASNKTRSTLTFAIFASVLTLNVFMATWSYSQRYGFNEQMYDLSGGIDIAIVSQTPIPDNTSFDQLVTSLDSRIEHVSKLTIPSDSAQLFFQDELNYSSSDTTLPATCFVVNQETFWSDNETQAFELQLMSSKNVLLDSVTSGGAKEADIDREDQTTWEAFFNGTKIHNSFGEEKPFLISSNYYLISPAGTDKSPVDESIWLQDKNGTLVEFVIGAITSFGSPIEQVYASISISVVSGPMFGAPSLYIPEEYAQNLAFYPSELVNASNMFLVKTSGLLDDQMNEDISKMIESTANSVTGSFRQAQGMYGVIGVPLWSVFEFQLEMQYRMFNFMQVFTSLGFLVGIIGLLVVSVRSVSERKREIGMMRAIGFTRSTLILAILTELVVMGFIGLVVGLINGSLLGWALTDINSGGSATFLIPWAIIGLYSFITFGAAFIAAIIPGWRAAQIPPSEALRYVG